MKAEQLYQHLRELSEKLGITVSEQSLKQTGLRVRSGLCKVKNQPIFIMDKRLSLREKNRVLATCLAALPHEEVYVVPAVRDYLEKFKPSGA